MEIEAKVAGGVGRVEFRLREAEACVGDAIRLREAGSEGGSFSGEVLQDAPSRARRLWPSV